MSDLSTVKHSLVSFGRLSGLVAMSVLVLITTACGSSQESDPSESVEVVEPQPEVVPPSEASPATEPESASTPVTETVTPAADEDTASPAAVVPTAPAVESIYEADPNPGGWPITAGEWVSYSFSPPLQFTLPVDGTITYDSADALEIAVGDPTSPDGYIVISTPIAVSRPSGPIPIDLVDADNALAGAELLFEETGQGPLGEYAIRDIVMPDTPPFDQFAQPCYRPGGRLCLDPLVTRAGFVFLETGLPHRFVTQDYGDDARVYVVVTATDPANEDLRAMAADIALSVMPVPGATHDGPRWLTTLGTRVTEIPAGSYLARVGNTNLAFSLTSAMDQVELTNLTPHVVGLEDVDGVGWIWIRNFADFLDPETERSRTDRIGDGPLSLELFEQDLRDTLIVLESGQHFIGGVSAPWFDTTADPEKGDSCAGIRWPDPEALCQFWTSTPRYQWLTPSGTVGRNYYLEAQGLIISISPYPDHTIEDVLERFQPILDGFTILES